MKCRIVEGIIRRGGTINHCGRGARAKKAHPLYIHSFKVDKLNAICEPIV
jgi:hypothetical protein